MSDEDPAQAASGGKGESQAGAPSAGADANAPASAPPAPEPEPPAEPEGGASAFPELQLVDELITGLEAMIAESDETPLTIALTDRPRRAVYRVLNDPSPTGRKAKTGDAVYLDSDRLILRCTTTEVVRLTPIEVIVQAEKSGRGETAAVVRGKAAGLKRVRGGYDIEIDIAEMRKTRVTPGQKLRECLDRNDSAGWNRWCQELWDHIDLVGVDLKRADLAGYDLCCTDLTGADLTGANLSGAVLAGANLVHCKMESVTVTGTDFFRARMHRNQAHLLQLCGMLETESVIFE